MILHQYLWLSVLGTEAAIVISLLYIDMNVFFFFPLVTVHLYITLDDSALITSLIFLDLTYIQGLKLRLNPPATGLKLVLQNLS